MNPSSRLVVCMDIPPIGSVKCIPHKVAKQRLAKHVPGATNTHNNRRIVGRVILCAVHVVYA
jgi:hypothetical protein